MGAAKYWPAVQASGAMQLMTMPAGVLPFVPEPPALVKLEALTPYVLHRAPPKLAPVPLLMIPSVWLTTA